MGHSRHGPFGGSGKHRLSVRLDIGPRSRGADKRNRRITMRHLLKTAKMLPSAAALVTIIVAAQPAVAQDASATYRDIEQTLGMVPGFFKMFPEVGVAGAWSEFKTVQLNPQTALSGKTKELIGLAVSAQIPCQYCIYFHTAAAKLNGATDEEIREAVAMAAIARHWSTVLNGMQVDLGGFKRETDTVLGLAAARAKSAKSQ
jgi:AhpD family alkylhydroperoxidase